MANTNTQFATHLIVSDSGLIGNIHKNSNPFLDAKYVVSMGDSYYTHTTLDGAIACAMRMLPKGASLEMAR